MIHANTLDEIISKHLLNKFKREYASHYVDLLNNTPKMKLSSIHQRELVLYPSVESRLYFEDSTNQFVIEGVYTSKENYFQLRKCFAWQSLSINEGAAILDNQITCLLMDLRHHLVSEMILKKEKA
jgi:hypothetical protein